MSFLNKLLGKTEQPKQRVQVCVECGMPVADHKQALAFDSARSKRIEAEGREEVGINRRREAPSAVGLRSCPSAGIRLAAVPPIPGSFVLPQRDDEPVDDDLLLAFSTEPGGKSPESTESLAARVECLERALHRSTREIESLKSELAILVGTVDDTGKNARRPITWAPKPASSARTRFLTATAGSVFGLAVGILGWTLWSRDSIGTTVGPAPEAAAVQPAGVLQPVAPLAAATPEPAPETEIDHSRGAAGPGSG